MEIYCIYCIYLLLFCENTAIRSGRLEMESLLLAYFGLLLLIQSDENFRTLHPLLIMNGFHLGSVQV